MEERYSFKAKRKNNGEWVIGALIIYEDETCKIVTSCLDSGADEAILACAYDVDKDTICQCTGLKDKNDKLIWENDIMVAHLDDNYPKDKTYIKVLWRENGFYSRENGSIDIIPFDKFDQDHFEVCGNFFDNAELLESEG